MENGQKRPKTAKISKISIFSAVPGIRKPRKAAETSRTFSDVVRTRVEAAHGHTWPSRVKTRKWVQQHPSLVLMASAEAYKANKDILYYLQYKDYLKLPILHYRGGEEGRGRQYSPEMRPLCNTFRIRKVVTR
jgi:hypothetical protein